jgi:hypothetical protein
MIESGEILASLRSGLRDPLLKTIREIAANYLEHRWEPSELNGGKFCEVTYSIVEGAINGTFPPRPSKPRNMVAECRALEGIPANPNLPGDHSLRILIPRLIAALYDIRNNRGVGHIGGDVDPNFMDATAVYSVASWILAELVRIFHEVTTAQAQDVVTTLIERKSPLIWEIEGKKRVLDTSLSNTDQVLVLLYGNMSWVAERDLFDWIEYSNPSVFRKTILAKLHRNRLIEYDEAQSRAKISPIGIKEVEQKILNTRAIAA